MSNNYYKKEQERAAWREAKYQELLAQLQSDEAVKAAVEGYHNADEFIKDFASYKLRILEYGGFFKDQFEKAQFAGLHDALDRLKEIQQKKLFDLQCLWRAEQITIPQIRICADFGYWEKHILNCPFLDPVSEADLAIYMQYVQSNNFCEDPRMYGEWQDYEEIKEAYTTDSSDFEVPEWYEFHNSRTGHGMYMLLPDIRGEKEEHYMNLWRQQHHARSEARQAEAPPPEKPLPNIQYYSNQFFDWFVQTFEDAETQKKYADYGGEKKFGDDEYDEQLSEAIDNLHAIEEPWPIEACYDWREAVRRTLDAYHKHKIAEALPLAFEEYMMYIQAGIRFEDDDPDYWKDLLDMWETGILTGRRLSGEPEDFDF